jgi:hypothetical protein
MKFLSQRARIALCFTEQIISGSKASDFVLYSGDVRFESRLRYRMSEFNFFVVYLSSFRRKLKEWLETGHDFFLHKHFKLIEPIILFIRKIPR